MSNTLFLIILLLTFPVFFVPRNFKYYYSLLVLAGAIILSSVWLADAFSGTPGSVKIVDMSLPFLQNGLILTIDRLSAFFLAVINITVITGFLYARDYIKPYYNTKNSLRISIHFFSYIWLYISMILVVTLRDGLSFLIAWEIMALSSFFLVIFDAEERKIMKTGINYLIQMHAGMFFVMIALLIVGRDTGNMSFDSLGEYFSGHSNFLIFLLFFIGFGVKAGFIPMHSWLPEAHPAAPSHVSGVMSGVMIKMGIYGIFRVLMFVQHDMMAIGITLLVISVISGVLGVMMAIMQHDLKRLLAYHSIENIGIIGMGAGLGMVGLATDNQILGLFCFGGGLLHVLNHSLFKSLLFFSAGSVYKASGTRNIEQLGGLIKNMPKTSILFLVGSLAICGLPPFNGFISEYLIYAGMFKSLSAANLYQSILILGTIVALSLIGGLAVFCFTKAFGITFLGVPRTSEASLAKEVSKAMLLPQYINLIFIVLIGLIPMFFVRPVFSIIIQSFNLTGIATVTGPALDNLVKISMICGVFVLTTVSLLIYRHFHLKSKVVTAGPTWGCGYTACTSKHQYTASSFAYNYNHVAKPVLQTKKFMKEIKENDIFPGERNFATRVDDVFKKYLIDKPVNFLTDLLKKIAVMQTGLIHHYILYAFIFMLLVFLLTYFNLI